MERIHTIDAKTETTVPTVIPDPLPIPTPIEVRGRYFLGQEDRNFRNTMYGIGDYLFIDGTRRTIKIFDAAKRMVVDNSGCVYTLLSEPDMDLFKTYVGIPWDRVKNHFIGDNYSDYVPGVYLSFAEFADSKLTLYKSE